VTGTHLGPFGGIPPTGRKVDYPLVAIFEFEEDRLVCEKVHFDTVAILSQIGVLPDPGLG
jgi:predicted ester cyclase